MLHPFTVDFGYRYFVDPVTISTSGSSIAGETYSLTCSAPLFDPVPLPSDIPSPNFQWFCGPNGNTSLPSGVTPMSTQSMTNSTSITYTTTLQFSQLHESHAGIYMCRIGGGNLAKSATVTIPGISSDSILHSCCVILIFPFFSTHRLCPGH